MKDAPSRAFVGGLALCAVLAVARPGAGADRVLLVALGIAGVLLLYRRREALHAELDDLYNKAPCGYHSLSDDGTYLRVNDTELNWVGYRREELVGLKKFSDLVTPAGVKIFRDGYSAIKKNGSARDLQFDMVRKDGSILPVLLNASAVKDERGRFVMSRATIYDMTQRYEAERAVVRLTRSTRTLSLCNEALVRAKNENELLERVCRIIVEQGGYRFAWVGWQIEDDARSVQPVAQAGYDEGYLAGLNMTWADQERGGGPTGTAIRNGTVEICRDIGTDPRMAPWREEALKRGYRGVIALPLRSNGRILGALMIYTDEPGAFVEAEIALLRELADDLSYGIDSLRERAARELAEEALRKSEQRFKALFQQAPMGIALIDSLTGHIEEVNPMFAEIAGRSVADLPRIDWMSITHPEDVQKDLDQMALMNAGKIPGFHMEKRYLHPNGAVVWINMTIAPLKVEPKSSPRHFCMIEDITERKRASEAQHRTEIRYRRLFESANDGILIVDSSSEKIVDANSALLMLFGYAAEECVGRPLWVFEPFKAAAAANPDLRAQVGRGKARHEDLAMRAKDGREIAVELVLTQYTVNGGVVLQYSVRDMSERKRLQAQILHGQKMESVGLLAGGIAHDLNNILMVILGNASFLLSSLGMKDPRRADVEEIQRAEERAAALTRQLLIFSRKQPVHPVVLDLNDLVRNLQKMLVRIIGEDVKLEAALWPQPILVRADAGQLEQVIMNLAVNARDAMPSGGRLSLRTYRPKPGEACHPDCAAGPDSRVRLEISDTGTGMTPEVMAHVFEPFYTTKPAGKGTGLGLSTAYGIVRQTGGGISVRSAPGRGTVFSIDLPLAPGGAPAAAGATEVPATAARGRETILLVEDDEILRRIDLRLLEERGYHVLPARDGEEALSLLHDKGKNADLLLTDVVMPGISGGELAREARSLKPGLRVIFVSGYVDNRQLDQLTATKAEFLQKPVAPEVLARKIREVLDRPAPAAAV